uniref:Uncharacterized protein n=1 Tax=Anguilla anguilla TaxID=7936 RepID=A0A0E9SQC3_ANGAN
MCYKIHSEPENKTKSCFIIIFKSSHLTVCMAGAF